MKTTKLYARESVMFDAVLNILDSNGVAVDITDWAFALDLMRQAGAPEVTLAMAATSGAQGMEVVDGSLGQLRLVIDQATLSGIPDTTGDFTLFGDLLGTSPGGDERIVATVEINITTAGSEFPGGTNQVVLDAISAAQAARAEAAAINAEAAIAVVARDGSNLLDPAAAGWELGKRINQSNGNADTVSGWDSTPFIPVEAGKSYVTNVIGFFALYDANQNYLQGLSASPEWVKPFLTPPANGFVRGSAQSVGNYSRDKMFFQEGAAWPLEVEPYGPILDDAKLVGAGDSGFADNAIGPAKLATWEPGENRANPTGRVDGKYMSLSGGPVSSASYSYWPAIEVEEGQVWTANQSMRFVTFLDAGGLARSTDGLEVVTQFTVPAGARYVIPTSNQASVNTFAIALGSDTPKFTPYRHHARLTLPTGERLISAGGDPDHFGLDRLRETRQRLRALRSGVTGVATVSGLAARLTVAMIGDSWVHDAGRFGRPAARSLWTKYHSGETNRGPIGMGWISFKGAGSGSSPNGAVWYNNVLTGTGTWASENGTSYGPDTGSESSSTAGDTLTGNAIDFDYDLGFAYDLYADGGAGAIRYRWTAAGAWVDVDLSALPAGLQVIPMTGMPASGTGRFTLEVVSGSPKLFGMVERHPTNRGILAHKLGATGTRLSQWAALDATQWQAGITALAPDLVTILHGTNDQSVGRTKAQFKADAVTLIDRIRTARPTADILLIAPAENQRTDNPIPMSEYQAALYEIAAKDRDVAFLNLQAAFGKNAADYANGSGRPWFASDLIHPDPATGGYAMTDALLRAIGEVSA